MTRPVVAALVIILVLASVFLWLTLQVDPTSVSQVERAAHPGEQPGPIVVTPGALGGSRSPDRASGLPPEVLLPTGDPTSRRIEAAKGASGLGALTDMEMQSLMNLVVSGEQDSVKLRDAYLESGGDHRSLHFADLDFSVEGWVVRAQAVLEGTYALVPTGESLGGGVAGDPNVHVVVGPGGKRGDKSFQTHIMIDMRRYGRFAAAKKRFEALSRESDAAKSSQSK